MTYLRFAILPLFAVLCIATESCWAVEADARNAALQSIDAQEIKEFVGALADDTFEGRESGSRGNRAASIYIIERLKKVGVRGAGAKDGFYQNFGNYHNILGWVEGRDSELKMQVIIVSAHFDHVGYGTHRNSFGPVGLIHNGADDNASGVAGLLELAEAVCKLPEKPRRSIMFAFWDGEEKGLLGSQHWAEHPTVPLDRVPVVINADMIGRLRNSKLDVFGVRTSRGLRRLISRQNDAAELILDFNWEMKGDSDHHTFFSRGIPVVMVHTGLHNDYHRPSDDADKVNVAGLQLVARLMFNLMVELADMPVIDGFRRQSRQESRFQQRASESALAPLPGRLGIRWDERKAEKDGSIVVAGVTPGSAADKAGLRVGDKLTKFAERPITTVPQFRLTVLTAKNPVAVTIERPGQTDPVEATLQLPGEPVRLGISWRTDEAEPGCVIINRVTAGSPADMAGLRVNDRIYRIGGQEFGDGEQFRQLATTLPGAIVLEVETVGRVHSVEIPPLADEPQSSS